MTILADALTVADLLNFSAEQILKLTTEESSLKVLAAQQIKYQHELIKVLSCALQLYVDHDDDVKDRPCYENAVKALNHLEDYINV